MNRTGHAMAILLAFAPNFCYLDFRDLWQIVQTVDPSYPHFTNSDRVSFHKLIERGYFISVPYKKQGALYIRSKVKLTTPRAKQRPVVMLADEFRYKVLGYNPDLETKRALYGQFCRDKT